MPETPRVYWDACVMLSYIDDEPERAPNISALLGEAREGRIEIYTSVVSITEVAFGAVEKTNRQLSEEVEEQIQHLWTPGSPINLVEVSLLVVEKARDIMRDAIPEGAKIAKPMDAIHVASAQRLGANLLHSYDGDLRKIAKRVGLESDEPNPSNIPLF